MGLIETEIKEIRQDRKHFLAGKTTIEDAYVLIALHSQAEKWARLFFQIECMYAKYGIKHQARMARANFIGNGTVIDLSPEEIEEEKILCPLKDKYTTRAECLDYSGSTDNIDKCAGCDVGVSNKKLLIGNTPLFTA